MPKHSLLIIFSFISIISYSQTNNDFEKLVYDPASGQLVFDEWKFGGIDSLEKHSGKYSAFIESAGDQVTAGNHSAHIISFKNDFEGNHLTFTAYLKCHEVTGQGNLRIIARQRGKQLAAAELMNASVQKAVKGTLGWDRYYVNIRLPENADTLEIGFSLTGKGKLWIDDIELFVDAKPLAEVPRKRKYKADDDTATFTNLPALSELNKTKIENLYLLGKIWGLLKYYHPAVAGGEYNWDNELFRFLPAWLAVKNNKERDVLLTGWLNKLGEVPVCNTCSDSVLKNAKLAPDLSWINSRNFSAPVQQMLKNIIANRYQGNRRYYIDLSNGTAQYKHEQPYSEMHYPPNVYRLLALYRYWNLVEYYYPYRYLIGEDREAILRSYIPQVVNAADATGYHLAVARLIATIHDSHAFAESPVLDEYYGKWWFPFTANFIENKLVVTQIDRQHISASDIRKGDIIEAIDELSINELMKKWRPLIPTSNEADFLSELPGRLMRGTKDMSTVKFRRGEAVQTATIQKYQAPNKKGVLKYLFPHQTDSSFFLATSSIGYLNPFKLKIADSRRWMELFRSAEGLIIDCRQYPAGVMEQLGNFLLPHKMQMALHGFADPNYPGVFTIKSIPAGMAGKENNTAFYKGKVVVLVNAGTHSFGEYFSMMVRSAPGAKVVGSTTSGADGSNVPFYLPGGIYTAFSANGIYYPDGRETQRIGIVPDIVVTPTIKGFMENRDEQLEAAIRLIKGK